MSTVLSLYFLPKRSQSSRNNQIQQSSKYTNLRKLQLRAINIFPQTFATQLQNDAIVKNSLTLPFFQLFKTFGYPLSTRLNSGAVKEETNNNRGNVTNNIIKYFQIL